MNAHRGKGPGGRRLSDARIVEEVSERLTQDRLLDARGIEVSAQGGMVVLRGVTPRAADVELAEMIAKAAPGVTTVDNHLVHQPGPSEADHLGEHEEPAHYEGRWGRWLPPVIT